MRKVRLSPLQRDIIWLLEEAGGEDLACIVNTLKPPSADTFERDVAGLIRLGYVVRSESPDGDVLTLTATGYKALTT